MPSRIFAEGLLEGQVAVVAAAGSALGRATSIELAACGATVIAGGREREPLEETVARCEGGRCEVAECDIRDEDQVAALVDAAIARHGRIDTLVNDAGDQPMSPAEETGLEAVPAEIRLHLEGIWLMTHAVATRAMIPAGGGKVVNLTPPPRQNPPAVLHSATARAAVENMTRTLSIEWARFGIRLVAVAAGLAATPEEHSWLVAYLASPAGDYHSGAVMTLDGTRDD